MHNLLAILVAGDRAALPLLGLEAQVNICLVDLHAGLSAARAKISATLREEATPWVLARGRAVDPFLRAVWADLSLSVSGAFLIGPRPWLDHAPLDHAPLPFPAVVIGERVPHVRDLAESWHAVWCERIPTGPLLADPRLQGVMERRERSIRAGRLPHAAGSQATRSPS